VGLEVVLFVVLAGIAVAALVAFVSGSWGAFRPRRLRSVDSVVFSMRPKIICSKAECSVEVDYEVQSDQSGAAVELSVRTPANRTINVASQMRLQRVISGDDMLWNDGPGHYTFTWRATGLQQGSVVNVHDVHVIPDSGGTMQDPISVTFDANAQNRRVVGDLAVFGTVAGRKGRSLDTCEKYMALASVRYISGGIPGYQNDLSLQIVDGLGQVLGTAILSPRAGSDTLSLVNPVPISNGIAIESKMTSGVGPEFPIGIGIPWVLEYTFKCL